MNDIKLYAESKQELETLILAVRIYSDDIGMEYGIVNGPCYKGKAEKGKWWME